MARRIREIAVMLLLALIAVNLLTFGLFYYDKQQARRQGIRVPESILLLGALAGGSPAAWIAMRKFRHKTQKTTFRVRYWGIVVMQVAALMYWAVEQQ